MNASCPEGAFALLPSTPDKCPFGLWAVFFVTGGLPRTPVEAGGELGADVVLVVAVVGGSVVGVPFVVVPFVLVD